MEEFGCQHWNDCFTCPYPQCINGFKESTVQREQRREKAHILAKKGMTHDAIARELGISRRTIERDLTQYY